MRSPTARRLNWMLIPLAMVAWMAAPEWPARAGMMDSPWREGWLPIASAWAETHPVPQQEVQNEPTSAPVSQPTLVAASPVVTAAIPAVSSSSVAPATAHVPAAQVEKAMTQAPLVPPTSGTVLMLGDSLMGEVAAGLRQHLPRTFTVVDRHKSSTGLTNLAYYDWPGSAQADTTETHPQWVVIHMGANDAQDMLLNGHWIRFGSPAWREAYLARAQSMLDRIHQVSPSTTVVWVGLPAMRSAAFDARIEVIRQIQAKAAASRDILYLDGHTALGQTYAKDGVINKGQREILRANDGIHYSRVGGVQIAHEAAVAPILDLPWGAQ